MNTEAELCERVHYAEGTADLAMKHRDDAETRRDALATALELARSEMVVAIAFLGRDSGTDRLQRTVDDLVERLVKAEAAIRETQAVMGSLGGTHEKA